MKSERMMTCNLGLEETESGKAFRVIQTRDVIEGWASACWRISPPMNPVAPVNITFIAKVVAFQVRLILRLLPDRYGDEIAYIF